MELYFFTLDGDFCKEILSDAGFTENEPIYKSHSGKKIIEILYDGVEILKNNNYKSKYQMMSMFFGVLGIIISERFKMLNSKKLAKDNTLDCVSYIRELKDLNINIHFEGLNIDTLDSKGELLITILASLAQEESQNISCNIRWSVEKRFEQGHVIISQIYGYRKDENKMLIIEPNEAVIVRRIYDDFLSGYTANQIAQKLMEDGVPTYSGKSKWRARGVLDILINEKYKGDAVLQKTYKASFLSDKRVVNEGQAKQWYVENSHPAIIDRETYDKVQAEIKRRNDLAVEGEKAGGRYSRNHVFSTIIKCNECG